MLDTRNPALEALLARFPGEEDLANGEAWL